VRVENILVIFQGTGTGGGAAGLTGVLASGLAVLLRNVGVIKERDFLAGGDSILTAS